MARWNSRLIVDTHVKDADEEAGFRKAILTVLQDTSGTRPLTPELVADFLAEKRISVTMSVVGALLDLLALDGYAEVGYETVRMPKSLKERLAEGESDEDPVESLFAIGRWLSDLPATVAVHSARRKFYIITGNGSRHLRELESETE